MPVPQGEELKVGWLDGTRGGDLRNRTGAAWVIVRVVFALLFALVAAYAVSLFVRPVSDFHVWLDGWTVATFELLASFLIIGRGLVVGHTRRYAILLGLAGCAWALGDFANTYAVASGQNPARPALFDFFWAAYFPLAFAGLMALLNRDVIRITAANYLDGLLLLLVFSATLIAFLFEPIKHAAGQSTVIVATNLVPPALDVPVLALTVIGLTLSPSDRRGRWWFLMAAALANVVGDSVAVFPQLNQGLLGNALNALAWPTSLVLVGSAFWLVPGSGRTARENHSSAFWVPGVGSLVALAILFVGLLTDVSRVGMGFAWLALAVCGLRFGLTLRHSRELTDRRERELEAVAHRERDSRDALEIAAEELRAQSQRDAFGSKLAEALEMADEEHQAYEVTTRALIEIVPAAPAELLLADSSRAHLRRATRSPVADAPGCEVQSPFACVAVRRGQPVTFESSEALNACPKLRGRAGGPCSAVCVPLGFMGRALGVLHATGPVDQPPSEDQTAQLVTLATQAGARIGTLRAFEKTQLQASTDALTGLINRRTLEGRIRELLQAGVPFALAVADLDKFKAVNDTYGHEAGDRALRLFSQVATATLRENDLLARWGGEEFTLLLPSVDRHGGAAVVDRIRKALADSHTGEHPRFTASFGVTDTSCAASMEQLLQIADQALYRSKQSGRDRVTTADAYIDDSAAESAHATPVTPIKISALHQASIEPDPRPTGLEIR